MTAAYRVPTHSRLFRWLFRPVFQGIFHLLFRIEIIGTENIPIDKPYLVAINHVSLYEPPFILAFWPRSLEAVGAVDIWHKPGQSVLAQLYGGIKVNRGQFDRRSIDVMLAAVNAGHPLLIAPEGGRSHDLGLRRGLPGAAYIAHKTGLPVIPVGIVGTTDDLFEKVTQSWRYRDPKPELGMRIGSPIHLDRIAGRGEARRQALQENVDSVMVHIGRLLPTAYHGVYAPQIAKLDANKAFGG